MDNYTPIFRSAIDISLVTDSETASLTLTDMTGLPVVLIQGRAEASLQAAFGQIPARPGDLVESGQLLLARLLPDAFYLFGKIAAAELPVLSGGAVVTDYRHGKAVLALRGEPAPALLSKLCGLNFGAFPNMHAAQTTAAKITALIARCDEEIGPVYYLHVDRPFGQYFWETVWEAGQEFGIRRTI